jgi:hypothetical protein
MTDGLDKRDVRSSWRSGLIENKARRWCISAWKRKRFPDRIDRFLAITDTYLSKTKLDRFALPLGRSPALILARRFQLYRKATGGSVVGMLPPLIRGDNT